MRHYPTAQPRLSAVAAAAAITIIAFLLLAGPTEARYNPRKAVWATDTINGKPALPIFKQLGVGIYSIAIDWSAIAKRRPKHARDPRDPAYDFWGNIGGRIDQAHRYGFRINIEITKSPAWANGGHPKSWAPKNPNDYADFAVAVARRYRFVHLWMVWGEPSRRVNFMPYTSAPWRATTLAPGQARGPGRYAQILDATYGALKKLNRSNLIIGGNTYAAGDIRTDAWIRNMKLPGGKPPRMDLYGHNPFSFREPSLTDGPWGFGLRDFTDLDLVESAVNRFLARPRGKRSIKLFLAEWCVPTQKDSEFHFAVDEATQARWIRSAFRIANRRNSPIYSLGWIHMADSTSKDGKYRSRTGLYRENGTAKPGLKAFKDG